MPEDEKKTALRKEETIMDEMKLNELHEEELEKVSGGASGSPTRLPDKAGCIVYKVKSGECLSGIAGTYRTTVQAIMNVNIGIISNRNFIRAGYYIYIPV